MMDLASLVRWLRLKRLQFEVTLSVYMFTPAEKFVFYSIAFLLCSLSLIAIALYLPHHIAFLIRRAEFYLQGEVGKVVAKDAVFMAKDALYATAGGDPVEVVREL